MPPHPSLLSDFASRYIWWRDPQPPSEDRIIAQVLNLGIYDDIRRLESAYTPQALRAVMLRAQPGWISPRSWSFWRVRLAQRGCAPLPATPPRRAFLDAVL
jgi:hypothetical protein